MSSTHRADVYSLRSVPVTRVPDVAPPATHVLSICVPTVPAGRDPLAGMSRRIAPQQVAETPRPANLPHQPVGELAGEESVEDVMIVLDDESDGEQGRCEGEGEGEGEARAGHAEEGSELTATPLGCAACEADLGGDFVSVHQHARLTVALCGLCARAAAAAEAEGALGEDGGEEW